MTDMTNMTDFMDLTGAEQWEQHHLEQICDELGLPRPRDMEVPVPLWPEVKPGQDLVIAGHIGLGGTVWMARHKEDILRKTLPEDYVESGRALLADMERVLSAAVPAADAGTAVLEADMDTAALETGMGVYGAAAIYNVAQGGIFGALWEFAQAAGAGIYTWLKDIPVRQQTIEFCEVFDLNPYQLFSGGCLLMAVENGCDTLFRMDRAGIPCSVIGKVTKSRSRVVAHDDTCRYLTRPQRDEIFKLL